MGSIPVWAYPFIVIVGLLLFVALVGFIDWLVSEDKPAQQVAAEIEPKDVQQ